MRGSTKGRKSSPHLCLIVYELLQPSPQALMEQLGIRMVYCRSFLELQVAGTEESQRLPRSKSSSPPSSSRWAPPDSELRRIETVRRLSRLMADAFDNGLFSEDSPKEPEADSPSKLDVDVAGFTSSSSTSEMRFNAPAGQSRASTYSDGLSSLQERPLPPPPDGFPSRGAIGHPLFCAKPCVFLRTRNGECPNGMSCNYCHADHRLSRDRQHRRRPERAAQRSLDEMTDVQLLITLHVALTRHLNSATMGEGPLREIIRSCEDDIARFQPAGTSTPVTPGMLSSFSRMTPGAMLSMTVARLSPVPRQSLSRAIKQFYQPKASISYFLGAGQAGELNMKDLQQWRESAANGWGRNRSKPAAGASKPGKAQGKGPGVAAIFQESLEREEKDKKISFPSWAKITPEAAQAQRQAERLQEEDPTVFQYDEILDDIKEEQGVEGISDRIRADTTKQKKRVGLHVPQGAESVKTGAKRSAKYVEKVQIATDRRKVEQQGASLQIADVGNMSSQDVDELKRRKKFEDELEAQEAQLDFGYRNLLNTGLASSRGGEKVREMRPAREEADELKEEIKETKEEDEDKIKAELAPLVEKDELAEAASSSHGVQDVAFTAAPGSKEEAKEKREEKALSAKERYMLRKKGLLPAEGEG
ncbi:unnamed protein product [Symbiodinium sp. KB8]|nr:unnamed protein product [Symbiodinium sp. KB8]